MHIAIVRIARNTMKRDINTNNEHAMIIIARASIAMSQRWYYGQSFLQFICYKLQVTGMARE